MNKNLSHYIILAKLFSYPSENLINEIRDCAKTLSDYSEEIKGELDPFLKHIERTTLGYQQEYFVNTFDVKAVCSLDIGNAIFGVDYRRSQLLANLKAEHRKAGNDCGKELPDHLPVLLNLLPKLSDSDFAEELAVSMIIPAVKKIIDGFRSDNNYYKTLLQIVKNMMEKDFPCSKYEPFQTEKI